MLLLTGIAVFESADPLTELRRSGVVATAVVGGGVGGLLMGIRSADNRRQRQSLDRQTEQTVLLNRLLRHEVLNALTAIRGHAGLLADGRGESRSFDAVASNVDRIEQTVDDVGFIVRTADGTRDALGSVDISTVVRRCHDGLPDADGRVVVEDI
jgi:signal transduction histidine kinase